MCWFRLLLLHSAVQNMHIVALTLCALLVTSSNIKVNHDVALLYLKQILTFRIQVNFLVKVGVRDSGEP